MSMSRPSDKPAGLTDSEGRIISGLVHQLRDVHPPQVNLWQKWSPLAFGVILAIFGAVLNNNLDAAREEQKAANTRINAIDARSKENETTISRMEKEIVSLQAGAAKTEDELRIYRVALSDFRQLQGTVSEQGKKLGEGREERLRDREVDRSVQQKDRDAIMGAVSKLETQVALLRQSVDRGAQGRNPDPSPFGDQNQMWIDPPLMGADPPILKATYRAPSRVVVQAARPAPRPRRAVRRRPQTLLVALFGKASKVRRSAFGTAMR